MPDAADLIGALADVFTWVGLVGAAGFGILALILKLADGTWLPARAVVEPVDGGHVVRWIDDDGEVNEAPLAEPDVARLEGRDMADIHYRRGWRGRMRLTAGSPAVRATLWIAIGLAALAILSFIGSWVLLAVQG